MSAVLRSADRSDVQAVTTVHAASRRAYYEAGGLTIPPVDTAIAKDYLAFWSEVLTAETNRAWIVEEPGECVGFLAAGAPVHEDLLGQPLLELIGLYLVPKVWGSGEQSG